MSVRNAMALKVERKKVVKQSCYLAGGFCIPCAEKVWKLESQQRSLTRNEFIGYVKKSEDFH